MSILAVKSAKTWILLPITLAFLIVTLLFPTSPLVSGHVPPHPDSGVFLYAGTRVLEGEIPYRDFWDHKPPAIYYVDALGLLIGGGSQWGVWILEVITLCSSALLSFLVLQKAFGNLSAVIGSSIWLLNGVYVFWLGNIPDVYALPFDFAMLYLFCRFYKSGFSSWRGYLVGLLFGIVFFFKFNFIGIWIALPFYLVIARHLRSEKVRLVRELGMIVLGASTVFAATLGYFALHGALGDFFDVAIRFNMLYAAHTNLPDLIYERYWSLRTGFIINQYSGSTILAALGWVGAIAYVRTELKHLKDEEPKEELESQKELRVHLLLWLAIALPIEVLLSIMGRFSLLQYFCSWQPIFSVMIGFAVLVLSDMLESYGQRVDSWRFLRPTPVFAAFMLVASLLPMSDLIRFYRDPQIIPEMKYTFILADYLKTHTEKDAPVVIWGREAAALYLSGRRSPKRFFYTIAFAEYAPAYLTQDIVEEYVQEIIDNRPVLIIFTQPTSHVPFTAFGKLTPADNAPPEWQRLFDFVFANYELSDTIGYGWPVYRLKN